VALLAQEFDACIRNRVGDQHLHARRMPGCGHNACFLRARSAGQVVGKCLSVAGCMRCRTRKDF
jgi:hypothetical protein